MEIKSSDVTYVSSDPKINRRPLTITEYYIPFIQNFFFNAVFLLFPNYDIPTFPFTNTTSGLSVIHKHFVALAGSSSDLSVGDTLEATRLNTQFINLIATPTGLTVKLTYTDASIEPSTIKLSNSVPAEQSSILEFISHIEDFLIHVLSQLSTRHRDILRCRDNPLYDAIIFYYSLLPPSRRAELSPVYAAILAHGPHLPLSSALVLASQPNSLHPVVLAAYRTTDSTKLWSTRERRRLPGASAPTAIDKDASLIHRILTYTASGSQGPSIPTIYARSPNAASLQLDLTLGESDGIASLAHDLANTRVA